MPDAESHQESTTSALAELLRRNAHRRWLFLSPGGNWGDHLIYEGAFALARRLGLDWKAMDLQNFQPSQLPAGTALYLQGGGGLNPWGSRRAFKNLTMAAGIEGAFIVQGPQSCDLSAETGPLLAECLRDRRAAEVHVFARERSSHAFMAQHLPSDVPLELDHDTALHLQREDIVALTGWSQLPAPRYKLMVSREDDEVPGSVPPHVPGAITMDPAYFATSFRQWLRIHACAGQITTNRLHSSIAGVLLGRQVTVLPGSYHKNRSIWEYSLQQRGAQWGERATPVVGTSGQPLTRLLPRRIAESWKVQRLLMRLRGVPLS